MSKFNYSRYFFFNIRVASLKSFGRSIPLKRLYALTKDVLKRTEKFNTPVMEGFLKEAIIVTTPFSQKDKSEKRITKQLYIDKYEQTIEQVLHFNIVFVQGAIARHLP